MPHPVRHDSEDALDPNVKIAAKIASWAVKRWKILTFVWLVLAGFGVWGWQKWTASAENVSVAGDARIISRMDSMESGFNKRMDDRDYDFRLLSAKMDIILRLNGKDPSEVVPSPVASRGTP